MEYKNVTLLERCEQLKKNLGKYKGKIAYAANKNLRTLNNESEDILAASKESDEYKDYQKKRIALCEKYAEKGEDGGPKLKDVGKGVQSYQIAPADKETFDAELKVLQEENQEVIDELKKTLEDFNLLLEEKVEVKLWEITVKEEDVKDLDGEAMEPLLDFININWE
jgi:hypothetical protein